jgi:hypothetical protein
MELSEFVVVSEHIRGVGRQGSSMYGTNPQNPERKVPAGLMHGMEPEAAETLCGEPVSPSWYIWRNLVFPRSMGRQCPACFAVARRRVIDVRDEATTSSGVAGRDE